MENRTAHLYHIVNEAMLVTHEHKRQLAVQAGLLEEIAHCGWLVFIVADSNLHILRQAETGGSLHVRRSSKQAEHKCGAEKGNRHQIGSEINCQTERTESESAHLNELVHNVLIQIEDRDDGLQELVDAIVALKLLKKGHNLVRRKRLIAIVVAGWRGELHRDGCDKRHVGQVRLEQFAQQVEALCRRVPLDHIGHEVRRHGAPVIDQDALGLCNIEVVLQRALIQATLLAQLRNLLEIVVCVKVLGHDGIGKNAESRLQLSTSEAEGESSERMRNHE